ncbi:hypothetical protein D9M68_885160 [compost metagenome]
MDAVLEQQKAHPGGLEDAVLDLHLVLFGLGVAQVVLLHVERKLRATVFATDHEVHLLGPQPFLGGLVVGCAPDREHVLERQVGQHHVAGEGVVQVVQHVHLLGGEHALGV